VNIHCHDHCQNNNECASEKAKRGFENTFINDPANPAEKGMLQLSGFSNHRGRECFQPGSGVGNPSGFFEHGEFLALREAIPEHLKGFITFAYKTGWRSSEIAGLTWKHIDRDNGIVRLEPGEAKNDEGRTVYLDDELKEVFQKQWESRKSGKKLLPYIFPNRQGTDKTKRFDKIFKSACKDAEIGTRLFHDFRRTAVRNMVRSGIPERVAMMISGHKTRSVFDRYNIVSDTDLQLAAQKQEIYLNSQMVTKTVTICDLKQKRVNDENR
jgi:integrase